MEHETVISLEQQLASLEQFYGGLSVPPRDPFIVFVWAMLDINSSPRKRDAALAVLGRIRALTPDAMWKAPPARLEAAVALAGAHVEPRLRALRAGVEAFRRMPRLPAIVRGPLPAARRALRHLPQLGDAGAHVMLLFAAEHPILPVDARVRRVALRLGYGQQDGDPRRSARSARRALEAAMPRSAASFRRAFLCLSHHAAATCADADPHCGICPLLQGCPAGQARVS
jgi:endonuclease-3